jgi:hypothetical protein
MRTDAPEQERATLIVVHESDSDARAILAELVSQVVLGNATTHLRVVIDGDTPADAALWTAEVIDSRGDVHQHQLFTYLAGLGTLSMFRYVALCTLAGDGPVAVALDTHMNALREKLAHLLGDGRPRSQARIGIVGFGEQQVDPRFFSAIADANLVVIPLDRLQDSSFAQPIQRSDSSVFHTHGAVELLSATGLWRTMGEAPIDRVRPAVGGGGDTRVRFVQSRMRLLRTPTLPVASLISEQRELPMPDGHQPAPNVKARLARAEGLLPLELRHEVRQPPKAERQQVDAKDLALFIGREVLAALVELPRLVWRVAGGEVGALTRRALQEAVGTESRIKVLRAEDEQDEAPGEERERAARLEIERRIQRIVQADELAQRLDPIPGEVWTSLVGETLGLIDGDADCAALRAEIFGDELYLPVDRSALLGGLERLPAGIRALAGAGADADPGTAGSASASDRAETLPPPSGPPVSVAGAPVPDGPAVAPLTPDSPLGAAIIRDAHRLDLIRNAWRSITARAGTARKGADSVYQDGEPYDLSGDVLTLRFPAQRSRYTARRAVDPALAAALLAAIGSELGGAPAEVRVIISGEERSWYRAVSCAALAALLDLAEPRVLVDLKKYGVKSSSGQSVVTGEELRMILAAERDAGPKLHDALSAAAVAVPELFGRGGAPVDRLREQLSGAPDGRRPVDGAAGSVPAGTSAAPVVVAPVVDVGRDDDGLLHRLRAAIVRQRASASEDIERLLGILRQDDASAPRTTVARSVLIGGALGFLLLVFRIGISDRFIALLQGREWTAYQLDLWFTVSTMIILSLALFLTDFGKRLGGQTRLMIFGAGTLVALAYVVLFFPDVRLVVSGPLRESRTFAVLLGLLTVAFVVFAAVQSWASGSDLRIRGSRVLGLLVVGYTVVGLILLQSQPGSWVASRSEEFARRFDVMLLILGLALVTFAVGVITIFRLRESRRLDNSAETREWALAALADAVEMRELLALAERQWLVTTAALAQLIRRPFGLIEPSPGGSDGLGTSQVLKSASVLLALNDRGVADLEARVRKELIRPSWLRYQYEALVRAHQELLATRSGVPVASIEDRRPEVDVAVPTEQDLITGEGRGDRFEFLELIATGRLDEVRQAPIARLDIAKVFRPMLAERSVQDLEGFGGRASTVRDFFEQVLPENELTIPAGVVSTALAANEDARRMRAFVWWPQVMLGEPVYPADAAVETFETDLFRRGTIDGAGLVSVRVDVSGEFLYEELVGAVEPSDAETQRAAEAARRYESNVGL